MLVLSRKLNEKIILGGLDSSLPEITLVVVEIKGDKVRLGIEAPKDVSVHRQEVWAEIQQEKNLTGSTGERSSNA